MLKPRELKCTFAGLPPFLRPPRAEDSGERAGQLPAALRDAGRECRQRRGPLPLANAATRLAQFIHFASRLAIRTDLASIETLKRDKKLIPRSPSTPFPNNPRDGFLRRAAAVKGDGPQIVAAGVERLEFD